MKLLYKEPEMDIEVIGVENMIVTSGSGKLTEGDTWTDPETTFDDFMKP